MPPKVVKAADKSLDRNHALLFKQLLQQYETKDYKKGIKTADSILKQYPSHGETMAMKGLILTNMDKKEEGWECVRKGLRNDLKSHICWHVYGLLYRADRNYEESMKCYINALKFDPQNLVILRDLAVIQSQLRVYPGLLETRRSLLVCQPDIRGHHTALAVAYHLNGEFANAEKVLQDYNEKLLIKPKNNFEHSSTALYHNTVIAESGATERALEHLKLIEPEVLDKLVILERRAKYQLILKQYSSSEESYRRLLDLNPECHRYYAGLEQALQLHDGDKKVPEEKIELATKIYRELQATYPKATAPKRRPLVWLSGSEFRQAIDNYLRNLLQKGVPSTFVDVKALYKDTQKADVIETLVESYLNEFRTPAPNGVRINGEVNGQTHDEHEEAPTTYLWTLYFLAQSCDHRRKLERAMAFIDEALEHTPTLVELHLTKARILKHLGDPAAAAQQMNVARELDLQDRFINTKSTKYYLRADQNSEAINTISLFVNPTLGGGAIGDLQEMQSVNFILEDGLSYARQHLLGLALKRFESIKKAFNQWHEDQFDFHQYCFRKGTIDAYMESAKWEDSIYLHPIYKRAARAAVQALLLLHRNPALKQGPFDAATTSESDRKKEKKRIQKMRAARSKDATREAEKKDGVDMHRKIDSDPLGDKLLATTTPLEDALLYLTPWLHDDPSDEDALLLQAEVYTEQCKLEEAVKVLQSIKNTRRCHLLQYRIYANDAAASSEYVQEYLKSIDGLNESVSSWNQHFLDSSSNINETLAGLQVACSLQQDVVPRIMSYELNMNRMTLDKAREMWQLVRVANGDSAAEFWKKVKLVWPLARDPIA